MDDKNFETLEAAVSAAKTAADEANGEDEALNKTLADAEKALSDAKTSQDLSKKKPTKTELEQAKFKRDQINKRIVELEGGKSSSEDEDDDDTPLTVGKLREIEKNKAVKTAEKLAESIEDETERDLVIWNLHNTIKATGNPEEDLRNARAIANASKNAAIAEEASRGRNASNHASGSGAPPKRSDDGKFQPTADELPFMRPPFNMTEKDIKAARKKAEDAQK